MANVNAPFGLAPVIMDGKEPPINVYAPSGYSIASGYSTQIRYGDLVKLSGTANVIADGTNGIEGSRAGIVKSAAGDTHAGVFAGVEYTDSLGVRQFSKYWPASTVGKDIVAYVYDHENTVFTAQYAGVTGTSPFTSADVGRSMLITVGSTSTKVSDSVVAVAASTAASDDLLCLGAANLADNSPIADYVKLNVLIRTHRMRGNGIAGYPVSQ